MALSSGCSLTEYPKIPVLGELRLVAATSVETVRIAITHLRIMMVSSSII